VRPVRALAVLTVLAWLAGCRSVAYNYEDRQLGQRTWEVTSSAVRTDTGADLARFVLFRSAELTRAFGYRYLAVRAYSGDAADYRPFVVPAGGAPVSEAQWPTGAIGFGYVALQHSRTLRFRVVDSAATRPEAPALDAEKILHELQPFIDRRR
jgi:hypothetical protein